MTAPAAHRRVDGRHILGIKVSALPLEMKVAPAFQQSDATIPAENAVVIAGRPNFFCFRKAAHGFFNQRQENVRSVADQKLGLGVAFVQ